MKKLISVVIAIMLLANSSLKADEGMWMLTLLNKNYKEMQEQGLKLSPQDIYSINQSSLKDAIVIFGGYCTGEIVSDQGLLFTNHHCGYPSIQQHSSIEHDYLKDGFWAETKADEIPTPGLFVNFLLRIEDVSNRVNDKLNIEMSEEERSAAAKKERDLIIAETTEGNDYEARVQSFFGGNNYYLLVYERYNDVRMVGIPPSSIGRFGHDTDNWIWPRHTSDFSIFRVYMSPDGKPAEYSKDNIALKPKHSLPISIKGYEKGDFTMTLGYPGSTTRYMTSFELKQKIEINNVNVAKIGGAWLEIIEEDMKSDDKIRIQYSAKQSSISNYWKLCIEQNKALKNLNVIAQKQDIENSFTTWVNNNGKRKEKYGETLNLIETACNARENDYNVAIYYGFCMRNSEILNFARRANKLYELLKNKASDEEIQKEVAALASRGKRFYKDYNAPTDLKSVPVMLKMYETDISNEYHPSIYKDIKGEYQEFTEKMFKTSIFASQEKFEKFLKNPKAKTIEKDLAFKTARSFSEISQNIRPELRKAQRQLHKGNRQFIAGLKEMDKTKNYYPDANGTMRLSYGTVGDYKPRDAVYYDYYTNMAGLMEKDIPGNMEFDIDDKLKKLYKNKDFGRYGTNEDINVCFTTNNDITGGNSGSPVINGNGELIGLAFDGNSEAMSGDIAFDPIVQKCINADVRYVLFIIEKYAGAQRLIDEMEIIE